MRTIIKIFMFAFLLFAVEPAIAQAPMKGFDYSAHQKLNKQAGRWGKRRVKASKGDHTNLKCSVKQTRRYARKSRS
jgi:hypothetical protein